jgi:hypothetical protein
MIGPHTRIVFDEAHFGIVESGSVVALARTIPVARPGARPGDLRDAIHLEECVQLSRRLVSAPREEKVFGRTSVAGLVTLLRRHIAPDRLAAACWQEWLKIHARDVAPARRAQAEAPVAPETSRNQ